MGKAEHHGLKTLSPAGGLLDSGKGADEKGVSSQQPARPLDSGQTVPVDQATSLLGKTCLDMGWVGEVGVPQGQPIPGVTMLPEEAHPAWLAKFSHVQLPAQER